MKEKKPEALPGSPASFQPPCPAAWCVRAAGARCHPCLQAGHPGLPRSPPAQRHALVPAASCTGAPLVARRSARFRRAGHLLRWREVCSQVVGLVGCGSVAVTSCALCFSKALPARVSPGAWGLRYLAGPDAVHKPRIVDPSDTGTLSFSFSKMLDLEMCF